MRSHILCALLLGLLSTGCVPVNDPSSQRNVAPALPRGLIDYQNGVYYVPAGGSDFGNALSALSAKHPKCAIAWSPERFDKEGKATAYFVRVALDTCSADR